MDGGNLIKSRLKSHLKIRYIYMHARHLHDESWPYCIIAIDKGLEPKEMFSN